MKFLETEDLAADLRNKITPALVALEKIKNGTEVPTNFIQVAIKELHAINGILDEAKK